jgi:hypothetical protein
MKNDFENSLHKLRESFKSNKSFAWNERSVRLSDRFDNLIFYRAGGACPVQAEGTYKDLPFYFRYRWGEASLGLGGEDHILNPEYESSMVYGDGLDGSLTLGEFHELFTKMLKLVDREMVAKQWNS